MKIDTVSLPTCEQFKKELITLCNDHDIQYNITTDDEHIVVHIKLARDFTHREHVRGGKNESS